MRRLAVPLIVFAAAIAWWVVTKSGDDPAKPLTVMWASTADTTACVASSDGSTVTARFRVSGAVTEPDVVTITVTAHADENTSQPIGTATQSVPVSGDVDQIVLVPIKVDGVPHPGEDGGTACSVKANSESGAQVLIR